MTTKTYLVATDDGSNPAYVATREAGLKLAAEDGATVVLYDRSAESPFTDPYPVGPFSDEDHALSADDKLEPETLRNLGRAYLADQLVEARERGLTAEAYLAQGTGAGALARAAARVKPDLVLLPTAIRDVSLADRVTNDTIDDYRERLDAEIRLVGPDGRIEPA